MVSKNLLEFASKNYDFDIESFKVKEAFKWGNPPIGIFTFNKNGKEYIIDFEPGYLPQRRQTRAELDFIDYLAKNNISVAPPLRTINGELCIATQENDKDFNITVFEMASGQFWDHNDPNKWNNRIFFNWGKLMGDMHRLAKDYKPSDKYSIPDIFNRNYEGWGTAFDCLKAYPEIYKITQELLDEFLTFPRDRDSYGLIHCDMHQNNFHIDGDKINLFDFGDNIYAWFALDIGIALFHALWWGRKDDKGNDFTHAIIENFIKGYLSANHLSDFCLSKIPMFMKYRQISCFVPWFFNLEDMDEPYQKEWKYNIENDILFDDCTLKSISDIIENAALNQETLVSVLKKMLGANVIRADYQITKLYGWVCDDVRLITGIAETAEEKSLPFKVVLKTQKKVRPPLDADSWTREYYFYASDFYKILDEHVGMPKCYHSEFSGEKYSLWLEYIEGFKTDLTTDDLEYVSEKLGTFHGKIYTQPELTENLSCLTFNNFMKKKIWSWHKSPEYDYLRSKAFDVPEHLKNMLIKIDDNKESVFEKIKRLPVVLYHGDLCSGNFFLKDGKVILFDWGHGAGWGYLGEDIANLISDNKNYELWGEYYRRFVPAYLRGFSEYADISGIENFYIKEIIILNYGYDIVQAYMSAKNEDDKAKQITALQKIYEMGDF